MKKSKNNLKILLVIPRYSFSDKINYDYIFPLGLGSISAVIKNAGYEVNCLNINHKNGKTDQILKDTLNQKKYDIACTGGNALAYHEIKIILDTLKKHESKPITILGGPIITSEPELIFEALNPSIGVIGEGEETIIEILRTIRKKENWKDIDGIIFADSNGKTIKTKTRKPITDLDCLPYPDFEGLGFAEQLESGIHSSDNYFVYLSDNPRIYPLLASRSCPYQCTFCYHDSNYRKRSIKSIVKELKFAIKRYNINMIIIYDDCFSIDEKGLYDFCREIKKLSKEFTRKIRWMCQLRVETVNEKMLKTMKDAGCEVISYGFESFSKKVLESMRKNITPKQIDYAFKKTLKAKIAIQANFIFGDTAETKETAKETLDYWKKNCKGQVNLGFIQPYPGSVIYERCIKRGIIKDRLELIKSINNILWLNMTDTMTDKEINDLKKEIWDATRRYRRFVVPKIKRNIHNNTYSAYVKCPYCKKEVEYNNIFINNPHFYNFFITCKECYMRFFMLSPLMRIAYLNYPKVRPIIDIYTHLQNKLLVWKKDNVI